MKDFVGKLEKQNELIRVRCFVDPVCEITEITDRFSKQPGGGKALLFENNGTQFPLLINALGSEKRICMALDAKSLDDFSQRIRTIFTGLTKPKPSVWDKLMVLPQLNEMASWMPKVNKGKGICQQVILHDPDLSILPVLKCWPYDGGRFITLPLVNTKDPHTGTRNIGMYRMQVFSANTTGMHWHRHKTGARHYEEYKKRGERMPVAVALGGDPAYTYAATAPLPDGIDEYIFTGFLRKKEVELVKCVTCDLEVPSDADIILEGYVDPSEELVTEGPFGDHTGFYSLEDKYPVFHVTCITHRKDAVYPATIVGIPPQEDAYIAKATERIFIEPIRLTMLPELTDMDLPVAGTFHNAAIISIDKKYPGQALKAMSSLWGAGQMMFNKVMIVVDKEVNVHDYKNVWEAVRRNTDPLQDLHFAQGPLDVLDHSSTAFAFGSKLGIDATVKMNEEKKPGRTVNGTQKKQTFDALQTKSDCRIVFAEPQLIICGIDKAKTPVAGFLQDLKDTGMDANAYLLLVDKQVDVSAIDVVSWLVFANIDPERDIHLVACTSGNTLVVADGTFKIMPGDHFSRNWPNITLTEASVTASVDQRWSALGLGPFISSPSERYTSLSLASGATVKQNPF